MHFQTMCKRCNSIKVEVFKYREGVVFECSECELHVYRFSDDIDGNGDLVYKEEIIVE